MIDIEELKNLCRGKWFGLLSDFGVDVRNDDKHTLCPLCGGVDRFRMDKDGSGYYCNQCGPGDALALIQKFTGMEFKEVLSKISEMQGSVTPKSTQKTNKSDNKKMLNDLWKSSTKLTGSDDTSLYLHTRKLVLKPDNVRHCTECYNKETGKNIQAMVALVTDQENKPVTIHRTYYNNPDLEKRKMLMPGVEKMNSCAIRLSPPKDGTLGVAEGIETAIAASQLFSVPVWATISSTLMETFNPPEMIKHLYIFGDNDANFTGQKSAYKLANRLIRDVIIHVEIPDKHGDWADEL